MKLFILSSLLLSLAAYGTTTYSPNDGSSPPGNFSSKVEEGANPTDNTKKVIKTTTIKTEEVKKNTESGTGAANKPVIDSDPNDEPYTVGPLPDPEEMVPEGMKGKSASDQQSIEAQEEEDKVDYSTTPESRTTTPLGPNKR
jgi:hypothetical protein